ncbi:glycosyltransferase family 2 protein [Formosa haliotis]|uniref:glycosyltransferase family 2 protein n=1 Tax=Formosa haliotis TaxID=1555194 RepID=UPI00082574B6|nr:glycosyltransferase [Formosa haliotis]
MNNFFLVIPTRERLECLKNLLIDLNAFSSYISQVVIVDQTEPCVEDALKELPLNYSYQVVKGDKTKSVNHSRNLALEYYNNEEWLFFLDDDLRIPELAFKKIIEHLTPNIIDVLIPGIQFEDMELTKFKYNTILDTISKPCDFSKGRFRLQVCSGLNIVKSQTFKDAGFYFDETYTIWGDDWDYGMRLLQAGANIYFQPDILVEHLQIDSGGQRTKKKELDVALEKDMLYYYFLRKHFDNAVLKKEYLFAKLLAMKRMVFKADIRGLGRTIKAYKLSEKLLKQ